MCVRTYVNEEIDMYMCICLHIHTNIDIYIHTCTHMSVYTFMRAVVHDVTIACDSRGGGGQPGARPRSPGGIPGAPARSGGRRSQPG